MSLPYDPADPKSIDSYAKGLLGKSLSEVTNVTYADQNKGKGDLGTLVERFYYDWNPPNTHLPDFPDAGLELKTTGVKQLKNGTLVPKERLVLSMISYHHVVMSDFGTGYLLAKIRLMLVIFYLYEKDVQPIDRKFLAKILWELPAADLKLIADDWQVIVNKVKAGKAHELSEGDTLYLGACTKSANAAKVTSQPFSDTPAKPRAFSLKPSYVRVMLEDKRAKDDLYENFLAGTPSKSFEELVTDKLKPHIGKTADELFAEYGPDISQTAKHKYSMLTNRLLGVKSKKVSEFEKAGIIIKTLTLEENGGLKESISFPAFKYLEVIEQAWDDSDFKDVVESKFFFIIFQKKGDQRVFKGGKFWSMPYQDRLEAQKTWEETIKRIKNRQLKLPGLRTTRVAHVRPHGRNNQDTYPAPGGVDLPKQCFWLNAKYIASQVAN